MKKVLIISATSFSNYDLSINMKSILEKHSVDCDVLNLETYDLPLFKAENYENQKDAIKDSLDEIVGKLISSKGLIFCAPEYNGSIPPIVTNFIAWISVATNHWRDGFKDKFGLVASSSGGEAIKYNIAMKNQLEHLGVIVLPRTINVSSSKTFDHTSVEKKLLKFINLL